MSDARFADGGEGPLRLRALAPEDLTVISALAQDAVFPMGEMTWQRRQRRFGLLLNRYRHEDRRAQPERVQSVLSVEDVMAVRTQGIDRTQADTVVSLLAVEFSPGPDGTGTLQLILAGDGAVALDVETLEVALRDVTRPYLALSGRAPRHDV